MKARLAIFSLLLLSTVCAIAQGPPPPPEPGQTYVASNFGGWTAFLAIGNASTGSQTVYTSPNGSVGVIPPVANNLPINFGNETLSPSAVLQCSSPGLSCVAATTCNLGSAYCGITATFSHEHSAGSPISPGSYGLQEAINFALTNISGTVIIDSSWKGASGSSLITAAIGTTAVLLEDLRSGYPSFYYWNGSSYALQPATTILPYPGIVYATSANGGMTATSSQMQTSIGANVYVPDAPVNSSHIGLMFSNGNETLRGINLGTATYTAGAVYVCQFVMPYTMNIGHLGIDITTLYSGGTVDFGFYNSAGTSLLLDSGGVSTTSTGPASIGFSPVTLYQNQVYLMAWAFSNATPAVEITSGAAGALQNAIGAVSGTFECATAANAATGSALPASTGALTTSGSGIPVVVWQL